MRFFPNSFSDTGWKAVEEACARFGLRDAEALYEQLERSVRRLQERLDGATGRRVSLTLPWPTAGRWCVFMSFNDPLVPASEMVLVALDDVMEVSTRLVDHLATLGEAVLQAARPAPVSPVSPAPEKADPALQRASRRVQAAIRPEQRPAPALLPPMGSVATTGQFALAL